MSSHYFHDDVEETVALEWPYYRVLIDNRGYFRVINEDGVCIMEGGFFND